VGGWISGPLSRSYIQVAGWKHWKQWCRTSIPGPVAVEVLLVIVDVKWAVELNFRTFEPVLHLSCWVKKRSCFLYLLWALESIYCQKQKDLSGSSLSGWIEFRDFCTTLTFKSLSLEASNQGIFPVISLLGTCSQRLNWPPTLFKFQDVWAGGTSKSLSLEASILGMFPVQAVLLAYQWLNLLTHS